MKMISQTELEQLKEMYSCGTRVKLLKMEDIQAPPLGTKGTVIGVDDLGSILVSWDTGSSLSIIYGVDDCMYVINDNLKQQIEEVRLSGKVNMLDVKRVQYIANQMNLYELVIFLEEEKEEYIHYLLQRK